MKAGDLIHKPVTISSYTSVGDAIELMSKKRLREIVLIEDGKLAGMVTLRSLIGPGVKKELEVSNFAFMPPVVSQEDDIRMAVYELVDVGLESLPVMDNLEFKGVVTSKEILSNLKLTGRTRDAMVDAVTIDVNDSVSKARSIMMINNINRLPVLKDGGLAGIVTSSDIARRVFLSKYGRFNGHQEDEPELSQPVGNIMTRSVVSIGPESTLEQAKRIMLEFDLRALPVASMGRLVGIVCRLDMLRKLAPKVSGVRIYFYGLEEFGDDLSSAIERHAKKVVADLAMTGKVDRVEITLKRLSESVYRVKIKAGEKEEETEGDDLLISVKKALKNMLKSMG